MTIEHASSASDTRIKCELCGALVHSIQHHLAREHEDVKMTLDQYKEQFPEAPVLSATAQSKLDQMLAAKHGVVKTSVSVEEKSIKHFHEIFELGGGASVMSSTGKPIDVTVLAPRQEDARMVPAIDPNYIFNVDILKSLMLGVEMKIPTYLWGHAGVGKTTVFEQIAARTKRPFFRVQHTANMEEEHIVGGWRLRDGKTHFELGPLPLAMKYGWLYMADEYDFGRPEVTSVYQAVLEGKPLVIKEADSENRVIEPHPDFRIVATGNTNGQGDESGLYAGTNLQNAANYERFGIVEQMPYMNAKLESKLVSQQGNVPIKDAEKLVDFANRVRTEFEAGKVSNPISPRSLIYAAKIGVARGNYITGLQKAFINRLTSVDKEAITQLAQRVFG